MWKENYRKLYSSIFRNVDQRTKRGTSVLVKRKYKRQIINFEGIDERIIRMDLNVKGKKMIVIDVYALAKDERADAKKEFF